MRRPPLLRPLPQLCTLPAAPLSGVFAPPLPRALPRGEEAADDGADPLPLSAVLWELLFRRRTPEKRDLEKREDAEPTGVVPLFEGGACRPRVRRRLLLWALEVEVEEAERGGRPGMAEASRTRPRRGELLVLPLLLLLLFPDLTAESADPPRTSEPARVWFSWLD